jgi:beta-glucosidase
VKELKGFSKVYLAPGATQQVSITIDKSALSFYDDRVGEWVAEPGEFKALIGNASDHISTSVSFKLAN